MGRCCAGLVRRYQAASWKVKADYDYQTKGCYQFGCELFSAMGACTSLLDGLFPRPGNGDLDGPDRTPLLWLPFPREARSRHGFGFSDYYRPNNWAVLISDTPAPHSHSRRGPHRTRHLLALEFLPPRDRRVGQNPRSHLPQIAPISDIKLQRVIVRAIKNRAGCGGRGESEINPTL